MTKSLLGFAALIAACSAGPGNSTSPSTSIEENPPVSRTVRIPRSWDELLESSPAVYFGSWETHPLEDDHEGCFTARRAEPQSEPTPTTPFCVTLEELMYAAPWVNSSGPEVYALVEGNAGGQPKLTAIANTRDELLERVRCGRLSEVWTEMPTAHRRCTTDSDCAVLEAMCFSDAVAASEATWYRDIVRQFGGTCLAPDAGVCAPTTARAVCRSGQCGAVEEP